MEATVVTMCTKSDSNVVVTDVSTQFTLGACRETQHGIAGYRFVVRSPLATQLTLCLFDEQGKETQYPMYKNGEVWHIWLAGVSVGQHYGFRAAGVSTPQQLFNPQKLLLDPYAKAVVGKPVLSSADDYARFLMADQRDNAEFAPKSQIVDTRFDWGSDRAPRTPWAKTIIYELHVKGFTQLHEHIPAEKRGTYAGLASSVAVRYLQALGVTAVELMPITYGIDEPHLQQKNLSNYWNYNTLSPFAAESRYWSGRYGTTPLSEFKSAVKVLHAAGIEVILDMVFNHSAEAEHDHPTFCQRGLANADFYWLNEDGSCINYTGCGNTINVAHPATQQWIVDCLCYWVEHCHVDGFRFDLGAVLGREPNFNRRAELLAKIAQVPSLRGVKFIVEPWDIGHFGYQLGNFPAHFSEWNDRFRDDMRAFFLQRNGNIGAFAERLAGSSDIFKRAKQTPRKTINFIAAHDGFTLADLVAYNDKHNHKNGEDNRDGHSCSFSDNHGVEGACDDALIRAMRGHSQRALLSALLLSNGTPMLLAGDEIGHSQRGNNNAYCQDNAITWLNWATVDRDLLLFTRQLIQLRKRIPMLNSDAWWTDGTVTWLTPKGEVMQVEDWDSRNHASQALQICLDGRWLLLVNGKRQPQSFVLPTGQWQDVKLLSQQGELLIEHLSITLLISRD